MWRIVTFVVAWIFTVQALAQNNESPANRRYLNPVFDDVTFTQNLVYGNKQNDLTGKQEALKLRVFEPKNDTAKSRPLFLLTPGGGFMVTGDDWMNDVATELAKAGYVVALNKYRLSKSIDTAQSFANALAKAVSDQRSALEFFVEDARNENRFRVDLNNVFIGGHSAGAITSMHTAYVDDADALPTSLQQAFAKHEVIPVKAPALTIKGVVNLAGMLTAPHIINRRDIPLLSIHGDQDAVVPVDKSELGYGAIALDRYAQIVDTPSQLLVIKGAKHNDTALPALSEELVPTIKRFMFNQLQSSAEIQP